MKIEYWFNKYKNRKHILKRTPKTKEYLCTNDMDGIFNSNCNIDDFDQFQRFWKQTSVDGKISVYSKKACIKEITSINGKIQIVSQKVLKAPDIMCVPDFECVKGGQRIIRVEGLICFSVNYISCERQQIVHTFHDKIPFSTIINLPLTDLSTDMDSLDFLYIISGCIEDIKIKSLNPRELSLSVILVLYASKSINRENCLDESYLKDLNIDCNNDIICRNCSDENEFITKGVFPQDKIEDILQKNKEYRKRVILTEVFKIPKCSPNIIKILSFNFKIKILCQRVVKTPNIKGWNLEGRRLTGLILLVDYIIEYHMKYSSNTSCESVHSARFEILSSFYITLPDTTLLSDKFKISYYVDDIYACILNEREIFNSTSIIFHANPISCNPRPTNVITFRGQQDLEIVSIALQQNLGLFKVRSTGETANPEFGEKVYFSFQVTDSNENLKYSFNVNKDLLLSVKGDENANNFELALHNKPFEEGDIIYLTYRERQRVSISNYQGVSENIVSYEEEEYHPKNFCEKYRIGPNGLEPDNPSILPNTITVKGKDNREVSIIQFNTDDNTLIVCSSGLEANEDFPDEVYFSLMIENSSKEILVSEEILGNQDADNFRGNLNSKPFGYGDILTLTYKEADRVIITNYEGEEEYNPKGISESYEITPEGLKPPSSLVENSIIFNGKEENEIAKVKFNFDSKLLLVTSTSIQANIDFKEKIYFSFDLTSFDGTQKQKADVHGNENADNFAASLNGLSFEEGDLITLTYRERQRVTVKNYEGQVQYHPKYYSENYRISSDGLEPNNPNVLNNVITFKGKNDREVSIVRFNKDAETLIVGSSGLKANEDFQSTIYFSLEIKDAFNKSKIKEEVQGNEDADSFSDSLNNFKFIFGDILTLTYKEANRVIITNYEEEKEYNPKGSSESYEITPNGLKPLSTIIGNLITINGSNQYGGTVEFSQISFSNNKLKVTSTTDPIVTMFSGYNTLRFVTKTSSLSTKKSLDVRGEENSEKFKDTFNDNDFSIGDILRFRYIVSISIYVKNYLGYINYILPKYTACIQITPNGLRPFDFKLFNNSIILNRNFDIREVVIIDFAKGLKLFVSPSGGKINASSFRRKPYFTFILKNKSGSFVKSTQSINGDENAINFSDVLDETNFSYEDIVRLKYRDRSMVVITNFNNEKEYHPNFYSESYVIKRTGLELLSNVFLKNVITLKDKINKELLVCRFDITSKTFILDSSGITATTDFGEEIYFSLTLKESDSSVVIQGNLKGNENADTFSTIFDEKSFDVGNIIDLTYKDNSKIDITNINGQEIYHPPNNSESYLITKEGLVPIKNLLPNIIAFRGKGPGDLGALDRRLMATISFDKNSMKLIVESTGRIPNIEGSDLYFSFTLFNSSGQTVASVNSNQNADIFADTLNGITFEYNGTVILECKDLTRVDITNFDGQAVYHPTTLQSSYTITPSGLTLK